MPRRCRRTASLTRTWWPSASTGKPSLLTRLPAAALHQRNAALAAEEWTKPDIKIPFTQEILFPCPVPLALQPLSGLPPLQPPKQHSSPKRFEDGRSLYLAGPTSSPSHSESSPSPSNVEAATRLLASSLSDPARPCRKRGTQNAHTPSSSCSNTASSSMPCDSSPSSPLSFRGPSMLSSYW